MKKVTLFIVVALLSLPFANVKAQRVSVTFTHDKSFTNQTIMGTMENNLTRVLNEINAASQANRDLILTNLPMNENAKKDLTDLWNKTSFYCDDDYVTVRLWPMANYYMVRNVPLAVTPRDGSTQATYQEAVVEFDKNGKLTQFIFAAFNAEAESMEKGGQPVLEIERRTQILNYCERFRTAYVKKDMHFMQQVFSEDALIITGSVVTTKTYDGKPITSVKYKKQNKVEYLANLQRVFNNNEWIDVKFSQIGDNGEDGLTLMITRSSENPNLYGVRLRQEWKTSRYHDEGYVFLLWDFTNEDAPVIHVRTWQPEWVGGQQIKKEELFDLNDFEAL